MKKNDLTQVKHVGAARMKLFNDLGITTIKQLYEMPLDQMAQIETIGAHYAKLIKDAVSESYKAKPEKIAPQTVSGKKKKIEQINQNLRTQVRLLKKGLKRANENLKPLGEKKYLALYIDFKKSSKTLRTRLDALSQMQEDLSKKVAKNIIKKADALNTALKISGKKPKKKKYKKISQEIQTFSKVLKKTSS